MRWDGGVTPQPPRWTGTKRGPAAPTQMGGSTPRAGGPVGLPLGCCSRVGFFFLVLPCFFNSGPWFQPAADAGFPRGCQGAQLFPRQLTPAPEPRSLQHTPPACKLCLCLPNLGLFLAGNQAFGRISQALKAPGGAGAVSTCALTAQRDGQGEGAAAAGGRDGSVQAAKADFLGSHLAFFPLPGDIFFQTS